jgi:hypothetical protein
MFYDRESMVEMFELSVEKRQKKGLNWIPALVTCTVDFETKMTIDNFGKVMYQWSELIRSRMHEKDAAYIVNPGNIFVLVYEDHLSKFQATLTDAVFIHIPGAVKLSTQYKVLQDHEAQLILNV